MKTLGVKPLKMYRLTIFKPNLNYNLYIYSVLGSMIKVAHTLGTLWCSKEPYDIYCLKIMGPYKLSLQIIDILFVVPKLK